MDFKDAVKTCLQDKYVTFSGRAGRSEFWWFFLFILIVAVIVSLIDSVLPFGGDPLSILFTLAIAAPSLAVGARRLHDTGRSGWWQLIVFVPFVGFIILMILFALEGQDGPNRFDAPVA